MHLVLEWRDVATCPFLPHLEFTIHSFMNHNQLRDVKASPRSSTNHLKIAVICFGHFDATIALAKYLPRIEPEIDLDLIFLLNQSTSIAVENLDFRGSSFDNGFIPENSLREALGPEIYDYVHGDVELRAFIFNSIKLTDLKNHQLLRVLKKDILSRDYDLIHFVGNNNDWIVGINQAIKNVPKVHTMHEPYPFTELSSYRKYRYKHTIQKLLDTDSHIIVPSDISYQRLKDHFETDQLAISIIPFSVFEIYRSYVSETAESDDHLLIYYGSISEYKGVPDLVDAMRLIYPKNQTIKCIIAGAGKLPENLQMPPNIELINRYLGNSEIADLNHRAALVVCPYRSASQSGVVMTSFAFGNPILATAVGAFPEMIEHGKTGILVKAHNIEALSEAILEAFDRPDQLRQMRQEVKKKYATDEVWCQIARSHLAIYNRLIRKEKSLKKAL